MYKNRSIGGYLGLELNYGQEFYKNCIRLNTGRNAFEYIIIAKGYRKIYMPYYTCDAMLEPIKKLNIACDHYMIDQSFKPIFDFSQIKEKEVFVYTNYFGLCDRQVYEISKKTAGNLIVDNSQAFFSAPLEGVDTFYSPRKFFGVPDGAYLFSEKIIDSDLEYDISWRRFNHLVGRLDLGPEIFYQEFKKNEKVLSGQPMKIMSNLTRKLLGGINYEYVAKIRLNNFSLLHKSLKHLNQLNISIENNFVPLVYPFLIKEGSIIKKYLLKNKIYIPTYWQSVLNTTKKSSFEYHISKNCIFLPVDQRYSKNDIEIIKELLSKIL